jgi:hypothetical protein
MKTYNVRITDTVAVNLTSKELSDLHERLTQIYNLYYDEIESEINKD